MSAPLSGHQLLHATATSPWRVQPANPVAGGPRTSEVLWAWRFEHGSVVLQSDDGDVIISADQLVAVANGLIAVHVSNGRPEFGAKGGGS